MTTPIAHAFYQTDTFVLITCPHCNGIHTLPPTIGRLTPIPALCNSSKTYEVTVTMKEKSVFTSIKNYAYDIERYRRKRREAKSPPSDSS